MPQLPERIESLDIGCGDGRSTVALASRLGITGDVVGIDKVATRLPADNEASNVTFATFDAMELPNKKLAQITTLLNVLPGLPDARAAAAMLRKAVIVARDFVYVAQPQFDYGGYLLRRGFKTWQSDQGRNHYQGTSLDYMKLARAMLDEGLIADFALMESERIRDSSDPAIHSVQSPPDSGPYDETTHRYKTPGVTFTEPVYARFHMVLCRKPSQLVPIAKRLRNADRVDSVIYSSMPL
jgi:hypothetical protein